MVAQIVAEDGIAIELRTVMQPHIGGDGIGAAEGSRITLEGVVIRKDFGLVAKQNKQIAVTPERQRGLRLRPERLTERREPRLGIFPGREIAVELVGPRSEE